MARSSATLSQNRDQTRFRSLDRSMSGEGGQVLCFDHFPNTLGSHPRFQALLERYAVGVERE